MQSPYKYYQSKTTYIRPANNLEAYFAEVIPDSVLASSQKFIDWRPSLNIDSGR